VTIERLPDNPARLTGLLAQLPAPHSSAHALAAHLPQQALVLPVAGYLPGANGTFFRSDITFVNYRAQSQNVLVAWLEQGKDGTNAPSFRVTVPSSAIDRATGLINVPPTIPDFVGRMGLSGLGSLLLIGIDSNGNADAQASIDAYSRIWTYEPGSQGPESESLSSTGFTDLGATESVAPGLRRDSGFRTNVGVVNLDPQASDFTVGASGERKSATFAVHVPPLSMIQTTIPAGDYGSVAAGFVSQRAGIRWVAYGSSLDQITGAGWISQATPVP
jgi:hypothetical protein